MNRAEAESFMKLVVPSVYEEIEAKRAMAKLPLYLENYDPAATINQYGDIGYNQEDAIYKAAVVVVNCCTKVSTFQITKKFLWYIPKYELIFFRECGNSRSLRFNLFWRF